MRQLVGATTLSKGLSSHSIIKNAAMKEEVLVMNDDDYVRMMPKPTFVCHLPPANFWQCSCGLPVGKWPRGDKKTFYKNTYLVFFKTNVKIRSINVSKHKGDKCAKINSTGADQAGRKVFFWNLDGKISISRSVSPMKSPKKRKTKQQDSSRNSSSSSGTPEEGRRRRPREARRGLRVRDEMVEGMVDGVVEVVERVKVGVEESSDGKDKGAEKAKIEESSDDMSI